ncbi:MAG: hypothetical protein KIS85_06680 [Anaerolineales bacterium]|nr:hypothetical protein [Anaerolineales bacterium]
MARIQLVSSSNPQITISAIGGSLHVKGHNDNGIRIEAQSEDALQYSFQKDKLTLACDSDCVLRVPAGAALTIQQVGRDAYVSHLEGSLRVQQVGGTLTLRNVSHTSAEQVAGSLAARHIEGNISVREVGGNAAIRNVEGDLEAMAVHANLSLRDIEGNIQAKTNGNADLRLSSVDDAIHIEAAGNLYCDLRDSLDANLHLDSKAKSILISTPGEKTRIQTRTHELVLGDGGSQVTLKAGGHIDIRSRGEDEEFLVDLDMVDEFEGLAEEITGQVTQQIGTQMEDLSQRLSTLSERFSGSGSRAAAKAQARVARAQERVARAQRRLETKLARRRGRSGMPIPPIPPSEPVDTKERAMVLNMLQEKKISIAEAEMLLHALEGRPVEAPEPPIPPEPPTPPAAPEDKDA